MGKTKIKTIDDSIKEPEKPKAQEMARGGAEEGSRRLARTNDSEEDGRRDTEATGPRAKKEKVSKRTAKKTASQPKARGKKYQEMAQKVNPNQRYSLNEAIKLAKETSYSKFSGAIEAHININAKNIRGLVSLPYAAGKKLTILAFGKNADQSGADIVGTEETISEIDRGKINFDVVVTTPEWMPKLAKVARILGPRGLMPNPKSGTITNNLAKAVADLQSGKVEYKTEANGQVIHLVTGKADQPAEEIAANIKALYNVIGRSKIKKITIASSMGPGVKVDLSSI